MPLPTLLLCALYLIICAQGRGEADAILGSVDQACTGSETLDNQHLPIGTKVAVLLVGLTRSITPAIMLPAFERHVLRQLGAEHVHVFIHTSPPGREGVDKAAQRRERREIQEMYQQLVPPEVLKAIVVTSSDYQNTPRTTFVASPDPSPVTIPQEDLLHDGGYPRVWEHHLRMHQHSLVWFYSLRDLFKLLLRQEVQQGARYSHVIRMRTDAIWMCDWANYSMIQRYIPPESDFIGAAATAGPLMVDHFWIASRAAARRAFVEMTYAMETPVDRRHMYQTFGCRWDNLKELHQQFGYAQYNIDNLPQSEHDIVVDGKIHGKVYADEMYASTDDACYVSVLGPHCSGGIYAEALVKYWLLLLKLRFTDCCQLTGEFVHSGAREVFLRACAGPRKLLLEEEEAAQSTQGHDGSHQDAISSSDDDDAYLAKVQRHKDKALAYWRQAVLLRDRDSAVMRQVPTHARLSLRATGRVEILICQPFFRDPDRSGMPAAPRAGLKGPRTGHAVIETDVIL